MDTLPPPTSSSSKIFWKFPVVNWKVGLLALCQNIPSTVLSAPVRSSTFPVDHVPVKRRSLRCALPDPASIATELAPPPTKSTSLRKV